MIKKIKGEGLKKCLNEYQENTNKLDEIRKTMQDMKEEFNRDIEIFKKNQIELLEMKKPQLKPSSVEWIKLKTEDQDLKTRFKY
jgi:hypothetical protein